jgi:hypothetical protein
MSTKQSNEELDKVSAKKNRLPEGLDLSDLNYLEHRDVQRVADELKVRADFVSKVKRGECYSVKILSALLKKARENKKQLEVQ